VKQCDDPDHGIFAFSDFFGASDSTYSVVDLYGADGLSIGSSGMIAYCSKTFSLIGNNLSRSGVIY
jgi:hypothetical protein